jgi:hypothetical protein
VSATLPARRRRARLKLSDWLLLAEGLAALAAASLAIQLLPFRRLAAAASRGDGATVADEGGVR